MRVIGEVVVEGTNARLSEAETELVALLACLRPTGAVNIDRLATMVAQDDWRTPNPRTIKARISDARSKLGAGSDGLPLIPDARAGNNSPGRYTVSCRILTDIDLIETAIRRAEHLSSGEAIELLNNTLDHLRGRPFTARTGYSWAIAEQQTLRAQRAVVDLAVRLVELAVEAADPNTVQRSDRKGRRHASTSPSASIRSDGQKPPPQPPSATPPSSDQPSNTASSSPPKSTPSTLSFELDPTYRQDIQALTPPPTPVP